MCLWLLTACLGLLPSNPSPTVVVVGAPQPILLPLASTAATTTVTTTTLRPPGNATGMPTNPPGVNPAGGGANTTPGAANPSMGTPPAGTPPSGMPPAGTPPSGTPPAGSPPPNMATMSTNQPRAQGFPPIDPRLGTTPPPPPYGPPYGQPPPLMGYSGQNPNFDTAVKFPRNKRSVLQQKLVEHFGRHSRQKRQSCSCVPAGTCPTQNNNGGAGLIDFRIVNTGNSLQCGAGQVYCCLGVTGTTAAVQCGVRQNAPAVTTTSLAVGQAAFGQYPWQALILTKQNDYIGGGVLIDQYNVLTVTHRLQPYIVAGTAPNVKVRLGEWDAAGTYEPIPYQEYTVFRTFSHPSYNAGTLQYDITVVRLSTPVPFTPSPGSALTINRACLPTATASFVGQRCWVSGWGKNEFGVQGQYQQILKQVDVPIVDSNSCEAQLRTARLGPSYNLDRTSFICAGGEVNKDSCTGDGGSGLVCQVNGQWTLIGLVAWGLGCANPNVPGVYVNIAALLPWVQQQVATV